MGEGRGGVRYVVRCCEVRLGLMNVACVLP